MRCQVPADFTPTPSDTNRPNVTAMGAIAVSGAQDHLGTASEVLETAIEHSDRMNEMASTIAEGINLARQIATFGLSLLD